MAARVVGGFAAKLAQSAKSSMDDVGWMVGELRKHRAGRRKLALALRDMGGSKKGSGREFLKMGIRRHRLLEADFGNALGKVSDRRVSAYLKEKSDAVKAARKNGGLIDKILVEEYGNVQVLRRTRAAAKRRKTASRKRSK